MIPGYELQDLGHVRHDVTDEPIFLGTHAHAPAILWITPSSTRRDSVLFTDAREPSLRSPSGSKRCMATVEPGRRCGRSTSRRVQARISSASRPTGWRTESPECNAAARSGRSSCALECFLTFWPSRHPHTQRTACIWPTDSRQLWEIPRFRREMFTGHRTFQYGRLQLPGRRICGFSPGLIYTLSEVALA